MHRPDPVLPTPGWASARGLTTIGVPVDAAGAGDLAPTADRALVAERIARYAWAFDERNPELLGDCFTRTAVWEGSVMGQQALGPVTGRTAIVGYLAGFWDAQDDQRRHMFTNIITDGPAGGHAVSHAYLLLTASRDARLSFATVGVYRFALHLDGGTWRIGHLACGFDVPPG